MLNRLNRNDWQLLLEKIDNEEVVLILGDELSSVNINGEHLLLKDYVLRQLAKALKIEFDESLDFSKLSYDYKRSEWQELGSNPYAETKCILEDISPKCYETQYLKKLLSIDKFKTVLTTSYDTTAYNVLKEMYSDVKKLSYKRGSNGPDIELNSDQRLLYHIFGEANRTHHSYVLSEDDLLEFIHLWMDQCHRPKNLSNILKEKYLLVVGCNYPNWLFRFFFQSLRFSSLMAGSAKVDKTGLLAENNLDPNLVYFLQRMETSIHDDAINFIDELCNRWTEYKKSSSHIPNVNEANEDGEQYEAFISYASEDYDVVAPIANLFNELGLKVWFDKYALEPGDEYERKISYRIAHCKCFIPILSKNTATTAPRFFRKEWKVAVDASGSHYALNDNFIQPVTIGGYRMDDNHVFNKYHAIDLSDEDERRGNIRRMIRNIRK